jgi:Probable cobalt transporter subunit (CbtA)
MLGGSSKVRREIQLSFMFVVLFLVSALMYPANPPAVGDPETINYRQSLYLGYLSIPGFAALGLALLYKKMGTIQAKKAIVRLYMLR